MAYTSNYGLPELRRAIARKLATVNGIHIDPEQEVIVTVGTNEAVLMIMRGLLNPGDEVLVPDPMWLHYMHCATLAGARVVSVPLSESNRFMVDPDDVRARITSQTRMLILNTPHNPTGAVYDDTTLRAIADVVYENGLWLVSDEIYEQICFDGAKHISPGSFPHIADRTITINGFSKAYAMTGWRIGYLAARANIVDILIRVHQYSTICATSFAQSDAVAALEGPQNSVRDMVLAFEQRRRVIISAVDEMNYMTLARPEGAFYAFLNIAQTGMTSAEFALKLLNEEQVAIVPGQAFGQYGEGFVRIAYACSLTDVERGMKRIHRFTNHNCP
ncbi:MAG: pyridoxal phosphate-dependent aminotransferase [Chloroflexota bacterium]